MEQAMNANETEGIAERLAAAPRFPQLELADARMRAEVARAQAVAEAICDGLAQLSALYRYVRAVLRAPLPGTGRLHHG